MHNQVYEFEDNIASCEPRVLNPQKKPALSGHSAVVRITKPSYIVPMIRLLHARSGAEADYTSSHECWV